MLTIIVILALFVLVLVLAVFFATEFGISFPVFLLSSENSGFFAFGVLWQKIESICARFLISSVPQWQSFPSLKFLLLGLGLDINSPSAHAG